MIKDKDVALWPDISRERVSDIFGTQIRLSTISDGKLYKIVRHVPTEALAMSVIPPSMLLADEEKRAEAELDAAVVKDAQS